MYVVSIETVNIENLKMSYIFRFYKMERRSIRTHRLLDDGNDSSGPNSPSIGDSLDDLSLDGSMDSTGRRNSKNKTDKALKNLRGKTDANSLFMADFDPTKGRKAKLKLSEKAYKDSNPGIVGQTKNRNVKKDSLYNQNGLLLSVSCQMNKYF